MSTHDVPGSNPANADMLAAGCWAEHDDGSLIYVKGTEGGQVVYEIYDVGQDPPVYYQDAMREDAFKAQFSWAPESDQVDAIQWLWHDKTPFSWSRVMKTFDKPVPHHANVDDLMSAAARVADSLKLRAQRLRKADIEKNTDVVGEKGRTIMDRIARAVEAFAE